MHRECVPGPFYGPGDEARTSVNVMDCPMIVV